MGLIRDEIDSYRNKEAVQAERAAEAELTAKPAEATLNAVGQMLTARETGAYVTQGSEMRDKADDNQAAAHAEATKNTAAIESDNSRRADLDRKAMELAERVEEANGPEMSAEYE